MSGAEERARALVEKWQDYPTADDDLEVLISRIAAFGAAEREAGRREAADILRRLSNEWESVSRDAALALTSAEKVIRALAASEAGRDGRGGGK